MTISLDAEAVLGFCICEALAEILNNKLAHYRFRTLSNSLYLGHQWIKLQFSTCTEIPSHEFHVWLCYMGGCLVVRWTALTMGHHNVESTCNLKLPLAGCYCSHRTYRVHLRFPRFHLTDPTSFDHCFSNSLMGLLFNA